MRCKTFVDFEISVSQCMSPGFRSSRMWCCAAGWVVRLLDPWRWEHHDPSKHWEPCIQWCNIMSEKTWILESKWIWSVSFLCLTKLLSTCVILGLCICCNKYVTPLHGLKFTACLYVCMWYVANNRFWVIAQWLALYIAWTGHKLTWWSFPVVSPLTLTAIEW